MTQCPSLPVVLCTQTAPVTHSELGWPILSVVVVQFAIAAPAMTQNPHIKIQIFISLSPNKKPPKNLTAGEFKNHTYDDSASLWETLLYTLTAPRPNDGDTIKDANAPLLADTVQMHR